MKKRIKKKHKKDQIRKTIESLCKKEVRELKYRCDRRDEDIAVLREENTAYKQLLHMSQVNFEWAMRKLIGDGESFEIPIEELKPNPEIKLTFSKSDDKIIVQKIKAENDSPIFEQEA